MSFVPIFIHLKWKMWPQIMRTHIFFLFICMCILLELGICVSRRTSGRSVLFKSCVTPLSLNDGLDFSQYDCSSSDNPHTQILSWRRQQARGEGGTDRRGGLVKRKKKLYCEKIISSLISRKFAYKSVWRDMANVCQQDQHSSPKFPSKLCI